MRSSVTAVLSLTILAMAGYVAIVVAQELEEVAVTAQNLQQVTPVLTALTATIRHRGQLWAVSAGATTSFSVGRFGADEGDLSPALYIPELFDHLEIYESSHEVFQPNVRSGSISQPRTIGFTASKRS